MSSTILTVFILFFIILILLGFAANKKNKKDDASEYFVVSRSLGVLLTAGTYFASFLSSGTMIGTAGTVYSYGWCYTWQCIGSVAGPFFLAMVFIPKFWRFGYYNNALSMPDIFAERYDAKWSRAIFSLTILLVYMFGLAAMYLGLNAVWGFISNLSLMVIVAVSAVIVLIYSMVGGARGVTWTDTACAAVMFTGVTIMLGVALSASGGFGNLAEAFAASPAVEGTAWVSGYELVAPTNSYYTGAMLFAWSMTWFLGNTSQPHQVTRVYLARNEKVARIAITIGCFIFTLVLFTVMMIGAYARVIEPALAKADYAFPAVVNETLPPIVAGVIYCAIVAAIFSTASTMLIISGQCVGYDFYKKLINPKASQKQIVNISRVAMAVISAAAIGIAYAAQSLPSLLFLWSSAFAIMGATIAPSLFSAFYWKGATPKGNIASMLTGICSALFFFGFPQFRPFGLHALIPSLVLSITVLIVVSKCTKKASPEQLDKFFGPLVRYGEAGAKQRGLI